MDEWRSIKWLEDYAQTHRIREDSSKHIGIVKKIVKNGRVDITTILFRIGGIQLSIGISPKRRCLPPLISGLVTRRSWALCPTRHTGLVSVRLLRHHACRVVLHMARVRIHRGTRSTTWHVRI